MRTNSRITLWHYDANSGEYERKTYRALVNFRDRLYKGGMKNKGYFSGACADVRIPMSEKPMVTIGDYCRIGVSEDENPRRIEDMKVTQIAENYRGTNPHLRLFLGLSSERS